MALHKLKIDEKGIWLDEMLLHGVRAYAVTHEENEGIDELTLLMDTTSSNKRTRNKEVDRWKTKQNEFLFCRQQQKSAALHRRSGKKCIVESGIWAPFTKRKTVARKPGIIYIGQNLINSWGKEDKHDSHKKYILDRISYQRSIC